MNLFASLLFAAGAAAPPAGAGPFDNPLAKSLLVLLFFCAVALFLRFLYGPGGRLREKSWDDLDAESKADESARAGRLEEARRLSALREELEPLMEREGRAFREFVEGFYSGDATRDELYRLKDEHSHGVFRNAWALIQGEPDLRDPRTARVLLLAALYHDLGRFEQLRAYHSFMDKNSVDHAALGARLLAQPRFLAAESAEIRRAVRAAVALHSAARLPERLTARPDDFLARAVRALRDADKLDILRVMQEALRPGTESDPAVSYDLPDDPDRYSPEVAGAALRGEIILSSEMRWRNDFRLYVCGWAHRLEYETSRRMLARSGHLESILAWLPADPLLDELRRAVRLRLSVSQSIQS